MAAHLNKLISTTAVFGAAIRERVLPSHSVAAACPKEVRRGRSRSANGLARETLPFVTRGLAPGPGTLEDTALR